MTATRRSRPMVLGVVLAAVVLALGSTAWACIVASSGKVWFCPTPEKNPPCPADTPQSFAAGGVGYSRAKNLPRYNVSYRLQYVSGRGNYNGCTHSTDATPLGTFLASNLGAWKAKAVTLPATPGDYTQCAIHPADAPPGSHSIYTNANKAPISFTVTVL